MAFHDFSENLAYSKGVREQTDVATIQRLIAGCVRVEKTCEAQDRAGVDYIATLRRGAKVLIDAKTRKAGCGRHWREGPELALETYSVLPENGIEGKVGWTLCEAKDVDYIFFTFDPADTREVFLYPFQLLRMAFRKNLPRWREKYKLDVQDSGGWRSQCVFVPESVAWRSVRDVMHGEYVEAHSVIDKRDSPAFLRPVQASLFPDA